MNFRDAYLKAVSSIGQVYGEDESKAIARFLFREKYSHNIVLYPEEQFSHEGELNAIIDRLKEKEPIQYILGYTWFSNLKILVTPDVLIPRPETEELIALAESLLTVDTRIVADICTGSGCIALALQSDSSNLTIIATDISEKALQIASENERLNFNQKRILFEKHDILTQHWEFAIPDIVICNPPYISRKEEDEMEEHVLKHEPHLALFVENDDALLFYKAVIQTFLPFTFPVIFFEINPLFSEGLKAYCTECGLACEIRKDMQHKERFAIVSS